VDETDDQFDARLCRVIAQAETTFFTESYVWKPLGKSDAPSAKALACVADGDVWHEFAPAADANNGFRAVLFRFSESAPVRSD